MRFIRVTIGRGKLPKGSFFVVTTRMVQSENPHFSIVGDYFILYMRYASILKCYGKRCSKNERSAVARCNIGAATKKKG